MEISQLTLKLIIILIPGALATLVLEKLSEHKRWQSLKFFTNAILLGAISYVVAHLIFSKDAQLQAFWQNLPQTEIPFSAVWKASLTGVLIGVIATALEFYKVVVRIGKFLRLSNKFGDESLYLLFLNAKNVNEVYVRDKVKNLTFHGIIESFAESDENKEIVLRDVKVYEYNSSALLYSLDRIYLCRANGDITIESPIINK